MRTLCVVHGGHGGLFVEGFDKIKMNYTRNGDGACVMSLCDEETRRTFPLEGVTCLFIMIYHSEPRELRTVRVVDSSHNTS